MPTNESKNVQFLPARLDAGVSRALRAGARVFVRAGLSANAMTVLSCLAAAAGGAFFALDLPFAAAVAILVCGVLDALDGRVAAATGTASAFGAMLDSTLDRYAEAFLFLGLAVRFRDGWILWLALAALVGSFMVSYTRARAEGLGLGGRTGWMRRAERFLVLGLAALIGAAASAFEPAMAAALGAIALFSNITAAQRAAGVRRAERARLRAKEPVHG